MAELNRNLTIKSMDDDKAIIAGYGVVFDGLDLDYEQFVKETDFMLDLVPRKLALYDHAQNPVVKTSILGFAENVTSMDDGLWVEIELDRNRQYVNHVLKLIEDGKYGLSSGALPQLVERSGKTIKRWPICEFSITPTPAEPRTIDLRRIKTLSEYNPDLKKFIEQQEADYRILQLKAQAYLLEVNNNG